LLNFDANPSEYQLRDPCHENVLRAILRPEML
jgi:hypothetical protein